MSHGLLDVTLQNTRHKVILHGSREVMSECQVTSHDSSVTSMVLMVQNGKKGAQWLSGRVLYSRQKGRRFEPHRCHCVVVLEQDTFILA